jgi:hypothetical protein
MTKSIKEIKKHLGIVKPQPRTETMKNETLYRLIYILTTLLVIIVSTTVKF